MNAIAHATQLSVSPVTLLKVVREIAADMRSLEDILLAHDVSEEQWSILQHEPRFRSALKSAVADWQSVGNTADRVKVKSLHFVEEALPELYSRAHDPKEPLSAKVELIKTVAKLAGIADRADTGGGGERMVVTINLGADHKLTFAKDVTPVTSQVTYDPDEIEEDQL